MSGESPERDHIADAIAALTAAARGTRTIGAGTPNEHDEPVDFGEIACHVIAAVAANLGGAEDLLAGRPGSWEASHVRDIVSSTAGDDPEDLLRYRTDPIRVVVDIDTIFDDLGLRALYEEADDHLRARHDDVFGSMLEELATSEEADRLKELQGDDDVLVFGDPDVADRLQAMLEINRTILQRAMDSDHPLVGTINEIDRVRDSLEEIWASDQQSYNANFRTVMRQYLVDRGLSFDVEILDIIDPAWTQPTDGIDVDLYQYASAIAPLPMTGKAPELIDGSASEALRRDGLTYLERATSGIQARTNP